jgi:hypothetical protein
LKKITSAPSLDRGTSWVWICGVAALIPYLSALFHCIRRLIHEPGHPGNLAIFRDAAIALAHGQDLYRSGSGDYIYPPLIAFLAQPLGWMSLHWAAILMLVVNLFVSLLTLKMIAEEMLLRLTGRATLLMILQVAMVAAWLSIDHIRTEFGEWETNIWMLLMFVLALRWSDRRPILAGIALGFAFNIKYLPIVFIPYLLIRRRWMMLGAFVISIFFWAMLPAISMGWSKNLAALSQSYSGIARLLGSHAVNTRSANVNPFTSDKSVSISSFVGRATALSESASMAIAAGIALLLLLFWAVFYRRNELKLIHWPQAFEQALQPYCALFGIEWLAILLMALMFSPYTNSAHLYLLLAINTGVAVLLIDGSANLKKWPLLAAALIMCLGTILPPGGGHFRHAELLWKQFGVCAWCMCVFFIALLWSGVKHVSGIPRLPQINK